MQKAIAAAIIMISLTACRAADGPLGGVNGVIQVSSDPEGGRIIVDDKDTGLRTPNSVLNIGGAHDVVVSLDSGGANFSYAAHVIVRGSEPFVLTGPLTAHCVTGANQGACYTRNRTPYTAGNLTVSLNALGAVFLEDGNGQGILWPQGTTDTYVSNGMPLIAGKVGGRAVALGMYDIGSLAGRPAPVVTVTNGALRSDQRTWIVPATSSTTLTTIRGIEVRERVLIDPSQPDVALIRLTYRNITNSPAYQKLDVRGSTLGTDGITYEDVYLGFGLDPDIGTADDDVMTYDPDQHSVFAYDANFNDARFNSNVATAPGMIGLRMLSAPSGAPIILNGYGTQGTQGGSSDWHAGTVDEAIGWGVMSGTAAFAPDDIDPTIGMLVSGESDVRMLVSAGPYSLRPAEELTIVVAVALAPPVPGTFTSLTPIAPGNPHNATRPIMATAAALRKKLSDAATLVSKIGN